MSIYPQLCAYQEYDTGSLIFLWLGYLFLIAFLPTIIITYNYGKVFLHFRSMLNDGAKADTIKSTAKAFFSYYVVFLVVSFVSFRAECPSQHGIASLSTSQRNPRQRKSYSFVLTIPIPHISSGSPRCCASGG